MHARIPFHAMRRVAGAAMMTLLLGSAAYAEDFHGFDPTKFDGAMLSADQLKAMVADATVVVRLGRRTETRARAMTKKGKANITSTSRMRT